MGNSMLTSIALALLLCALPSMEEESCAITAVRIVVDDRGNFTNPSQLGFILQGVSVGSVPTNFTWRKDGVLLLSDTSYTLEKPVLTNDKNPCSNRSYWSKITGVGEVLGVFTYTVSNPETSNDLSATYAVEAIVKSVEVTVLTGTSVRVSWDRLLFSDIKKYLIHYRQTGNRKGETVWFVIAVPSTETLVYITGLVADAEYQFRVVAQIVLGGEIVLGQISLTISTSTLDDIVSTTTLQPSNFPPTCTDTTLVAITAVAVFFPTILLYSIILIFVLMAFNCRRKSNGSTMEVKDVSASKKTNLQELLPRTNGPGPVYESISPRTKGPEVIYDRISTGSERFEDVYDYIKED